MPRLIALLTALACAPLSGCAGDCTVAGSPQGQDLGFMAQYAADVCLAPFGGPGLTVTLTTDGGGLGLGALGEREAGVTVDAQDPFRLGTVSEVYTAALVARLVLDGRLAFEDEVSTRLPWAVTEEPITLRHLLTQRSGLRDVASIGAVDLSAPVGPRALVEEALGRASRFSPGERHGASTTDALLLGLVVEEVLGLPFGEAMHETVLDPFGLGSTFVEGYDALPETLAAGHDGQGRPKYEALAPENAGGAWGIVTNGTDLDRFLRVVFEEEFLDERTTLEFTFPAGGAIDDDGFGFGVTIDTVDGDSVWRRDGQHPSGYGASFVYMPGDGSNAVALTNGDPSQPGSIAEVGARYAARQSPE